MMLDRELVEQALDTLDLDRDALHEDYSGRAMYGKMCPALYLDNQGDAYGFVAALGAVIGPDDIFEYVDLLRATRIDQLGLGIVVYWPSMELV